MLQKSQVTNKKSNRVTHGAQPISQANSKPFTSKASLHLLVEASDQCLSNLSFAKEYMATYHNLESLGSPSSLWRMPWD
jgi:hypothetical protein